MQLQNAHVMQHTPSLQKNFSPARSRKNRHAFVFTESNRKAIPCLSRTPKFSSEIRDLDLAEHTFTYCRANSPSRSG